jgi:hypothetical protein
MFITADGTTLRIFRCVGFFFIVLGVLRVIRAVVREKGGRKLNIGDN